MNRRKIITYLKVSTIGLVAALCATLLIVMVNSVETVAKVEEPVKLPIIMYHSILDSDHKAGTYVITPKQLENDMKYLKENGYTTISVNELVEYVKGEGMLPEKPIMLTFDDGYYNNYSYLYPLLKKYNMKAVISIIGKYTDLYSSGDEIMNNNYSHLTWDEMREMVASGHIEIQNHSYDMHSDQTRRGVRKVFGEDEAEYELKIAEDIELLQREINSNLGVTPKAFTYPFGFFNDESEKVVRELGFEVSFSCYERVNTITRDPECLYRLGRFNRPSGPSTKEFFAKIEKFEYE